MSSRKILRFPHVPQRLQSATVSLEQLIASVTAVWELFPDRAQHLQQYLDTIPLPAKIARMDESSLGERHRRSTVTWNERDGMFDIACDSHAANAMRAYIKRIARRR
jgi:hypothetical protein